MFHVIFLFFSWKRWLIIIALALDSIIRADDTKSRLFSFEEGITDNTVKPWGSPEKLIYDQNKVLNVVFDIGQCGCSDESFEIVSQTLRLLEDGVLKPDQIAILSTAECFCESVPEDYLHLVRRWVNTDVKSWDAESYVLITYRNPEDYTILKLLYPRPRYIIARIKDEHVEEYGPLIKQSLTSSIIDEVWVYSRFSHDVLHEEQGLTQLEMEVQSNLCLNPDLIVTTGSRSNLQTRENGKKLKLKRKRNFSVLAVFTWDRRFGWDVVFKAFSLLIKKKKEQKTTLYLYIDTSSESYDRHVERKYIWNEVRAVFDEMEEFENKRGADDFFDDLEEYVALVYLESSLPKAKPTDNPQTSNHHLTPLSNGSFQDLLRTVDLFAAPSRGEAFSGHVWESLIIGTPVMVARYSRLFDVHTKKFPVYMIDLDVLDEKDSTETVIQKVTPSVKDARKVLSNVLKHRGAASRRGKAASEWVQEHFSSQYCTWSYSLETLDIRARWRQEAAAKRLLP